MANLIHNQRSDALVEYARKKISRRALLSKLGWLGIASQLPHIASGSQPFAARAALSSVPAPTDPASTLPLAHNPFTPAQNHFLDELERRRFRFFWEQANPQTGMVKDRALAAGHDKRVVSSIASTGFGLTGLCIAAERGFIPRKKVQARVLATLKFLWNGLPNIHGFYYHFVDMNTGARAFKCEVSSIDTAMLMCGVLTCGEYFKGSAIAELAERIYGRVDWRWMLNGEKTMDSGWLPQGGFLDYRYTFYCELMMLYLLGLGSSTHPLPTDTWDAWKRPIYHYHGLTYIHTAVPIYGDQYSHAWFDFRGKRDAYANYFQNSVTATRAHKIFCLGLKPRFPDYSENLWGITSSDSVKGYVNWGGPPFMGPIDGTVVPAAAGGSLVFLPQQTFAVLKHMKDHYGAHAWKRYGLVNAFNPLTGWYDTDNVGIDAGIILLMAENARTRFVWKTFMRNKAAQTGMARAGFKVEDRKQEA